MFYRTNSPQTEAIQFKLHDIINNITDYIIYNKKWQIQEQQKEKTNKPNHLMLATRTSIPIDSYVKYSGLQLYTMFTACIRKNVLVMTTV